MENQKDIKDNFNIYLPDFNLVEEWQRILLNREKSIQERLEEIIKILNEVEEMQKGGE